MVETFLDLPATVFIVNQGSVDLSADFTVRHEFPPPPPWLPGWRKRVKMIIDQNDIIGALTNFPVLIHLSSASGINDDDVTFIFDEVGANSLKIAITTGDGLTECYVEVEKWDNGAEEAWLWAKIPSVGTEIYLYYDNTHADNTTYIGTIESTPGKAVWDSDFEVVAHFANDPSAGGWCMKGSTSNSIDGAPQGVWDAGDLVPAVAGDGLEFNQAVWVLMNKSFDYYPGTVEIWLKSPNQDAGSRSNPMMACRDDGVEEPGNFHFSSDVGDFHRDYYGGSNVTWQGDTSFSKTYTGHSICDDAVFHHLVLTIEPSNGNRQAIFYLDGVVVDSFVSTDNLVIGGGDPLWVGHTFNETANMFEGILDEMRVSSANRNEAWIIATYESVRDDLLYFGGQQVRIDLYGEFVARGEDAEDLPAKFTIRQGSEDLLGEFNVCQEASADLYCQFSIGITDSTNLLGGFNVRHVTSTDLFSSLDVRQEAFADLFGEFDIRQIASTDLLGKFYIGQSGSADLLGSFSIQNAATEELPGIFDIRQKASVDLIAFFDAQTSEDLFCIFSIRNTNTEELPAEVIIRHITTRDLTAEFAISRSATLEIAAEFVVRHANTVNLFEEFIIRHPALADLLGEFVIRRSAIRDLPAQFEVGQGSEDLPGKFVIRKTAILNLGGVFVVRHTETTDLAVELVVQHMATSDLRALFWVNYYTADLLAGFNVRQMSSRATDFMIIDNTRGLTIEDASRKMTVTPHRRMRVR